MKLYEPVFDEATGKVRIETELEPEEIRALLGAALVMCLAQGMAPKSIAHHFQPGGESFPQEEQQVAKQAQQAPQEQEKSVLIEKLDSKQQELFLQQVDPKDLPQA